MKKKFTFKQIVAAVGLLLIVGMYVVSIVFACLAKPGAEGMFMASLVATVIIPIVLYIFIALDKWARKNAPEGMSYKELRQYNKRIKNGEDYVCPDGTVVPNHRLTRPSDPPRSYAYCSDTICLKSIVPQIKGVNLLFHEGTFAQCDAARAKETFHTTAQQAAETARDANVKQLVIGHFSARYEDETLLLKESQAIFANTLLAKENLKITL